MFFGLAAELQPRGIFLRQAIFTRLPVRSVAMRDLQKDQRAMADAAIARDTTKLQGLIENQLERTYRKIEASGKLK